MLRKKKRASDIADIAAFFVELVSRASEYLSRPVHIHFITDTAPRRRRRSSDIGEFLPFLRAVLFDAAQSILPNPHTTLYIHTNGSPKEIAARIAEDVLTEKDEFFIITLGKDIIQKEAALSFANLEAEAKKHITLLHLPLETIDTRADTNALVSAVRILIKGEPVPVSDLGLRVLHAKT